MLACFLTVKESSAMSTFRMRISSTAVLERIAERHGGRQRSLQGNVKIARVQIIESQGLCDSGEFDLSMNANRSRSESALRCIQCRIDHHLQQHRREKTVLRHFHACNERALRNWKP